MRYDIIVIGAGHAGIEAAYAAAKLGCSVLLVTLDPEGIGKLSCNPAIGGVAKGNLVREVDALGGLIGRITDKAALSYRILNRSKGKAVWATRVQVDMFEYPKIARAFLEKEKNIEILQSQAAEIIIKNKKACGIRTNYGLKILSRAVVVCAGTFLKSRIHIGLKSFSGGRLYEPSSDALFLSLKKAGFKLKHFKTGTCARLDWRTINFSKMIEQFPDKDALPFSFTSCGLAKNQLSCFITHTNKKTHKVIVKNLKFSPLYSGKIKSTGVRYCPSLEDKIVKFPQRDRHQIFIEPAGRESFEAYPNGVSTSLPFKAQEEFIKTINGLEDSRILRPGYGIEHGLIDSRQLLATLEAKKIPGLYFAGQLNGTTGYEEAAAQGVVAGINSALKIKKKKPFILGRESSYIGVLIDDLANKGTNEPYRMFTSRSEFRLSLRETSSDLRLGPLAFKLGLINKEEYYLIQDKKAQIEAGIKTLKAKKIFFSGKNLALFDVLKRPKLEFKNIKKHFPNSLKGLAIQRELEIIAKYEAFLRRESTWHKELKNLDKIKLKNINYLKISSLSKEVVEKLAKLKPETLGEAIRISGITPAAVLNIYNHLRRRNPV